MFFYLFNALMHLFALSLFLLSFDIATLAEFEHFFIFSIRLSNFTVEIPDVIVEVREVVVEPAIRPVLTLPRVFEESVSSSFNSDIKDSILSFINRTSFCILT